MSERWNVIVDSHDGLSFGAYVAAPPIDSGPGIVLCHEMAGVRAHGRELADRLAEEGYVVFMPDLLWRKEVDASPALDEAGIARTTALNASFDDSHALRDIDATVAALRAHPAFRGQVGAVGFCAGGRLAVLAAEKGRVDCAVAYDAVGLVEQRDALGKGSAPMVLHFAGASHLTPPPAVDAIRDALAAGVGAGVFVYPGAEHNFCEPEGEAYDSPAAGMAWSRTIALLRRVLGPHYDLSALWEAHRACEFVTRDAVATMRTMVAEPYVNHVPTMTGGFGHADLHRFYRDHFIPKNPKDMRNIPISRTVGADRVVNEGILCFTHDCEIDWMLPGVPPTGEYVEVALVGIITFRGDKLVNEHIYWDQASVLVQIGLLDPKGLPVVGAAAARKVMRPELASNELLGGWRHGEI